MNRQLHDMGFETMISVWPRFTEGLRTTLRCCKKGWFTAPRRRNAHRRAALRPRRIGHRHHQPRGGRMVLEDHPRKHPEQGIRLALGRSDRARPAAEWRLLPRRSRHPLLQCVPAVPHSRSLRRISASDVAEQRALILSRDAYLGAQRNGAIFWSSDIHPTWDTLKRRSRPASISRPRGWRTGQTTPAAGSICRQKHEPAHPPLLDPSDARDERRRLRRLPGALHALVPVRHVPADLPRARQPPRQRGLVLRQAGRADPREVPPAPLRADAVHLLAWLPDVADGRAVHARVAHGFPGRPEGRRSSRRIHVRPGVPRRSGHRAGRHQPQGLPAGRQRTGTTSGPTSG